MRTLRPRPCISFTCTWPLEAGGVVEEVEGVVDEGGDGDDAEDMFCMGLR